MINKTIGAGMIASSAMAILLLSANASVAQGGGNPTSFSAFAETNSDGWIMSSQNVSDITRTSLGEYRVEFKQDVRDCARIATISANDLHNGGAGKGKMLNGLISVSNSSKNGNGGNGGGGNGGGGNGGGGGNNRNNNVLQVFTYDSTMQMAKDLPFDLFVICSSDNGGNGGQ